MKVLYATSIKYPSRLANRIQILETSKAFAAHLSSNFVLGADNVDKEVLMKDSTLAPLGEQIQNFKSSKSPVLAWKYINFIRKNKITHVYSREERLIMMIWIYNLFFRQKICFVYEMHNFPEVPGFVIKKVINISQLVVTITSHIKKDLVDNRLADQDKVIVQSDAVDVAKFDLKMDKSSARNKTGIEMSPDHKIIMYTGSLDYYHSWKGVDVLAEAALLDGDTKNHYVFVGGRPEEAELFQKKYNSNNIKIVGYVAHDKVPIYLQAADVLVLPNKAGEKISEYYTSPMKMFEYMASRRPIVASDLPSVREIVGDDDAKLVEPNSPKDLLDGIHEVLDSQSRTVDKIENAYDKATRNSWDKRASAILEKLNALSIE